MSEEHVPEAPTGTSPGAKDISSGAVALGALLAAVAGSWIWSRRRERPVEDRTRARLAPPSATAGPPSARDIKVG